MRRIFLGGVTAAILAAAPSAAPATTNNMLFTGTVIGTCLIPAAVGGTLTVNSAGTGVQTLVAGTATVSPTTTGYSLYLDTPTAFTSTPSGNPAITVTGTFTEPLGSFSNEPFVPGGTPLTAGAHALEISIAATTDDASVLASGVYTLQVTLRCVA